MHCTSQQEMRRAPLCSHTATEKTISNFSILPQCHSFCFSLVMNVFHKPRSRAPTAAVNFKSVLPLF